MDFHPIKLGSNRTKRTTVPTSKSTIVELSYPWQLGRKLRDKRTLKNRSKSSKIPTISTLLLNFREFQVFNHFYTINRMNCSIKIRKIESMKHPISHHVMCKKTLITQQRFRKSKLTDRNRTLTKASLKIFNLSKIFKRQSCKLFLEKLKLI